ncbi:MAG: alpha/beta hydrolase [Pirellula sp.]|nr:alpha/beta hydrolase [Pirellula sp.]
MQRPLHVVVGMILSLATPSGFAQETKVLKPIADPIKISLWDNDAPIGNDKRESSDAWITVHRPTETNGSAVVICPGGGYGGLVTGAEGHGIAAWLNRHGITGIVLEYRLPKGRSMVPLLDAQRALRMVRNRSAEWSLDPKRIGIMGFSAGGHLASTAGTHFDLGNPSASDPVERLSCRPDFMVLIYPVILFNEKTHRGSMKNLLGDNPSTEQLEWFSNEKQVTPETPPTFLAHALDDRVVSSDHSKAFFDALQAKGVESRYLELPTGDHGLNGYQGPMWDAWQKESLEWLAALKVSPRPAE